MSVPSAKTTVTADKPKRETERISSMRGRPLIAVSTGKVMNCSTSSGARPALLVSTCTWTLVTSGTASIGRVRSEATPITTRSSQKRRTRRRLSSEKSRMRWIMAGSSLAFAQGVLGGFGGEQESSPHHHRIPGLETREHLDEAAHPAAGLHL